MKGSFRGARREMGVEMDSFKSDLRRKIKYEEKKYIQEKYS
jgi:hypothetical protein